MSFKRVLIAERSDSETPTILRTSSAVGVRREFKKELNLIDRAKKEIVCKNGIIYYNLVQRPRGGREGPDLLNNIIIITFEKKIMSQRPKGDNDKKKDLSSNKKLIMKAKEVVVSLVKRKRMLTRES